MLNFLQVQTISTIVKYTIHLRDSQSSGHLFLQLEDPGPFQTISLNLASLHRYVQSVRCTTRSFVVCNFIPNRTGHSLSI